jgi:hypothetical protein
VPAGIVIQTQVASVTWDGGDTVVAASHLLVSVNQPFAAAVAGVVPANPASTLQATIYWGDGTQSAATFIRYADGSDLIVAAKTYTRAGSFAITVVVGDGTDAVLAINASADVLTGSTTATSTVPPASNTATGAGTSTPTLRNDGSAVAFVVFKTFIPDFVVTPQSGGQQPQPGNVRVDDGRTVQAIVILTQGPSTPSTRLIHVELNRSHFDASALSAYQGNIDRLEFASPTATSNHGQASTPAAIIRLTGKTLPPPAHLSSRSDEGLSTARADQDDAALAALSPELVATVLCSTWSIGNSPCVLLENGSEFNDSSEEARAEDYFSPLTLLQPPPGRSATPNPVVAPREVQSALSAEEAERGQGWRWPLLHVAAVCAVFQTMARFATTTSKQPSLRDEPWRDR